MAIKAFLQFTNGFMTIFIAMTRLAIMAKMAKMTIITFMEYYELASNMVFMGVFRSWCDLHKQVGVYGRPTRLKSEL